MFIKAGKKCVVILMMMFVSVLVVNGQAVKIKFVKEVKQGGALKLDWPWQMKVYGDHLFVSVHRDGDIIWFERNVKTGDVKRIATLDLNKDLGQSTHCDPYMVLGKNNILYVSGQWTHSKGNVSSIGLSWYQLDKEKGTFKKLGRIPLAGGKIYQSENPHKLYLTAWYNGETQEITIDPKTGTPSVSKRIKEVGLGSLYCQSPDKKFAYSIGKRQIGLVSVGSDASLTYINATAIPKPPGGGSYKVLAIPPDGKHLYLFFSQAYKKRSGIWIFDREIKTGEITFNQIQNIPQLLGTNHVVFLEKGDTALFTGSPESPSRGLGWFKRDAASGLLTFGGKARGSVATNSDFAYDKKNGLIYTPGFWYSKSFKIYSLLSNTTVKK